jgi:hypothetical protein
MHRSHAQAVFMCIRCTAYGAHTAHACAVVVFITNPLALLAVPQCVVSLEVQNSYAA